MLQCRCRAATAAVVQNIWSERPARCSLCPVCCRQTHRGADTASSWRPSGTSSVRSTRRTRTSSSPRWTRPPTRSTTCPSRASPPSDTFQRERTRYGRSALGGATPMTRAAQRRRADVGIGESCPLFFSVPS